jgi:hypothetical protein
MSLRRRTGRGFVGPVAALGAVVTLAGSSGSSFPIVLAVGLGVVGRALFAGGFVAVSRSRRAKAPASVAVRQD